MKILLDPFISGCTVYFLNKNTVKTVKGDNSRETIERLIEFIKKEEDLEILLECRGVFGPLYAEHFQENNIKFTVLKPEKEITI